MLTNMCDERARMLQDQFNVSMNHVHALAILVSTFHHDKHPSAIDQVVYSTSICSLISSGCAVPLTPVMCQKPELLKNMDNEVSLLLYYFLFHNYKFVVV